MADGIGREDGVLDELFTDDVRLVMDEVVVIVEQPQVFVALQE